MDKDQQEDRIPSWGKVFSYFLLLGFINIGGPVAQITMMFNHMVEKQHWLTKDRFTKIMAFCHILPGPEALQLAIYVGYLKQGLLGGTMAGLTFIIPGAAVMILLSYLYVTYGQLSQVNDLLFILKPAVLGIIAAGIIKLGKAAVKNVFLGGLVIVAVLAMAVGHVNFLIVLFMAGAINMCYAGFWRKLQKRMRLLVLAPLAWGGMNVSSWSGANANWIEMAWLFLKTGALSFGGAYASLIFMQHGAVEQYHWLTGGQLLDGVALSVATPGPFMLFTTFVGYLASGGSGAIIATFFVFLPSFVFVIAGARYMEQVRSNRYVQAFLAGGSAAGSGDHPGGVAQARTRCIGGYPQLRDRSSCVPGYHVAQNRRRPGGDRGDGHGIRLCPNPLSLLMGWKTCLRLIIALFFERPTLCEHLQGDIDLQIWAG